MYGTVQRKGNDSIATGSRTFAQFVMSPIFQETRNNHEALKPLWKFMKPFTVDHLYKHH